MYRSTRQRLTFREAINEIESHLHRHNFGASCAVFNAFDVSPYVSNAMLKYNYLIEIGISDRSDPP